MKYKIIESQNFEIIQQQHKINSLLAKVIDSRQLGDSDVQKFLSPKLVYHDFLLFEEADITLDRIHEAIDNNEKICIYGDYDCDGILATTILVQAFHELGVDVGYHIPNRFEDGYGLNVERVKQIANKGYQLIITVDNGIQAFEAVDCANELGVDVIVTDHHQFDNDLPEAVSFIHTKLSPDYPFKEISGGFVAYKLASALLKHQDKYLYCLAAITTISDMMPLLDENRSLVKRALTFMNQEKYEALELLTNSKEYKASTIGYTIAPKINSFGRLPEYCHPNILVKYFLKEASHEFRMKVSQIANQLNTQRQNLTNQQFELIKDYGDQSFLYWSSEDVHEGLIGLLASKYLREFHCPSFVMHFDKTSGIYKGSARSVDGFSLHRFFSEHQDLFVTCGGHALAGGFSVDQKHYDLLYQCLKETLQSVNFVDVETALLIDENDLTIDNIESLSMLEPFGMCNEEPLYYLKNIHVNRLYQLSEGKHLKFDLDIAHVNVSALYFNHGQDYENLKDKKIVNLIGKLNINEFRNRKSINIIVQDVI